MNMDEDALRRMIEGDVPTDDRFVSFEALSFELQLIGEAGREGDAVQMRVAVDKLRAWREKFDMRLAEVAAAVAHFDALDNLLE